MKITVVGTGYVGLVTGACFSEFGVNVTCVDKDESKIARLKRGEMPIFEPGLDLLVANNVRAGRLSFSTELAPAVAEADAARSRDGRGSRSGAASTRSATPSRPISWRPAPTSTRSSGS